jgi:nicotinamide-nucleotide amidase
VGPGAAEWYAGGVVAYGREVKHALLGVPEGPVVSREAAVAMARGAARLLRADLVVALTGAGGPDPQDGCPPGTVWLAVVSPLGERAELQQFDGAPAAVVRAATARALELLLESVPR